MTAWLFMLPLAILNLVVVVLPSAQSIYYSFTDWSGVGSSHFIGLHNYTRMVSDDQFKNALVNNLEWTAISLVAPMSLGLVGAYLLSRLRSFQILFRLAYFIPYTVATVISAAVWRNLLSPTQGLGSVLGINLLGSQTLALPTVALVNTWAFWGFLVVIYLSAMQSVNPVLYEAAALDGAGPLRQFMAITLPSISPTLIFMTMQCIIWSFLAFDFVYILTGGGPAGATDVLSTYMYRTAFKDLDAGYASAIGVVLALISGAVVVSWRLFRRLGKWES